MTTYNVVGNVTVIRTSPNPNNYNRTNITKMTVTDKDGKQYNGIRPASMSEAVVGSHVTFIAELRSSAQELLFYFTDARNPIVELTK